MQLSLGKIIEKQRRFAKVNEFQIGEKYFDDVLMLGIILLHLVSVTDAIY